MSETLGYCVCGRAVTTAAGTCGRWECAQHSQIDSLRTQLAASEAAREELEREVERLNGLIDRRNAKLGVPWPQDLRDALDAFEEKWDVELCAIEDIEKYNDWRVKESKRAEAAESRAILLEKRLAAAVEETKALRAALEQIENPPYGLGFNKLRGIARKCLITLYGERPRAAITAIGEG